ncbi:MAG: hypothetical protein ACRCUY_06005 [Thermoguttaceae bacterium]
MNTSGVWEHGTPPAFGNESRRFPTRYKFRCSRTGSINQTRRLTSAARQKP